MTMRCAACHSDIPDSHRFCGFCGTSVPTPSEIATITPPPGSPVRVVPADTPIAARIISSEGFGTAGFTPGSVLADRYRVIGLLGRGGMGEVYRADDLKLGQPVALKFLPRALAADPDRRDRFLAEVRITRQVSHPNVCRVYDVAEYAGQHFLSMEYIDGEDLASLLRRIGRLPADKALDVARQISAGLAAAHDRGVLHRDLKPANVMLDGRGRVRITDFGLAVAADTAALKWDLSGTPAYMAPEQFAGEGASVRTDIYALGLILYELYTGRRPFHAASVGEMADRKKYETPTVPSALVKDIDPAIERVILRAIACDPRERPESVAHIAALLPGGNPLEAALRAGETPSPEMVAASGRNEGLEPLIAWTLVAIVVAGTITAVTLGSTGVLWRHAAPEKPPDVLAEHARETLASLGYAGRPIDRASGFEVDLEHLRYLKAGDPLHWRTIKPDPSFLRFWYRESPQPLEALRFPFQYGNVSRITPADPPLDTGGMALVRLDPSGRLTQLVVIPPATLDVGQAEPDWSALLVRAGFDPLAWNATAPTRTPPVYADARAAWQGTWPNTPALPVRLEAAALGGKAVYFEAVYPWTPPPRTPSPMLTTTERAGIVPLFFLLAATIVGTAVFAQRNVRAGRGDRRGALRLSAFVFTAMLVSWFFGENHVASLWEVALVVMALSGALLAAAACWLAYLAAEPFLRRRWPEVLVTWNRLLAGQFRDPLVGRDVLVGCTAGPLVATIAIAGVIILPNWLGLESDLVFVDVYGIAYGVQAVVPLLVWRAAQSVLAGLICVFILLLLRLALRSQWVALAAFVLASGAIAGIANTHYWLGFFNTAILQAVFLVLLARVGLLAAVVQFYVFGLLIFFPVTGDLSAWYAGAGVTALLVLAALTVFGFTTALGGRPALGRAAIGE